MGLDITVNMGCKVADWKLQKAIADAEEPREEAYEMGLALPYVEEGRECRAEGLEIGKAYKVGDSWGFRAGSYGGYNEWRKVLAQLAGVADIEDFWKREFEVEKDGGRLDVPFAELLAFSDCEGTLGPAVCARLAKDFAEHDERAKGHGEDWFYDLYETWHRAMREAAEDGFISFH